MKRHQNSLDDLLRSIPRERKPDRDLWPGIESALQPRRVNWNLRAAAGIALAVVAMTTLWQVTRGAHPISSSQAVNSPSAARPFAATRDKGAALRDAQDELGTIYRDRLRLLPTGTRLEVEESLDEIHDARAGLRLALARHPASPLLQGLLTNTVQQEADLYSIVGRTTQPLQSTRRNPT